MRGRRWRSRAQRVRQDVGVEFGRIGFGSASANSAGSATIVAPPSIFFRSSSLAGLEQTRAPARSDRALAHLLHLPWVGTSRDRTSNGRDSDRSASRGCRTVAVAAVLHGLFGRLHLHGAHVHAVDLLARDVEGHAALGKIGERPRRVTDVPMRVAVVLDDVDDRQLPQRRHVEALVDLALVGRAVAEIGQARRFLSAIPVGEGQAGAERHLRADDAVPPKKFFSLLNMCIEPPLP